LATLTSCKAQKDYLDSILKDYQPQFVIATNTQCQLRQLNATHSPDWHGDQLSLVKGSLL